MAFPQSTLIVNGVSYNQSARKVYSLLVDGFGWSLDDDYWLEFHEVIAGPQPQFKSPFNCSLTINFGSGPVTVFTGQIVGYQPYFGAEGRSWSYRALGLKYLANWIPVTAIDGSGIIRFNVSPADVFTYTPTLAAKSVGQIIEYCLTQHAAALTAVGITTDATTTSQLNALTLVPNDEVDVQGERLWISIEAVLQQWARNIRLVILPSGLVRAVDITTGTPLNLVLGTDPVDPPLLSANWQHCATAMTVRGQGIIEPAYVSSSSTPQTLTPAWTHTQELAWHYSDFLNPPGWTDHGTCTVTSPTTVTCTSATAGFSAAVNIWDTVQAWAYFYYPVGSGLTFTESRQITSNTVSSGGVYTITLNYALQNSNYTTYKIIGNGGDLSTTRFNVGRLYTVTDPGGYIGAHLVRQFPVAVGYAFGNNQAALNTLYPIAAVTFIENPGLGNIPETGYPPFTVDPVAGQICFIRPVTELGNAVSVLNQGGAAVKYPSDITALLAYSRGALTTRYPTSGYSGTAYSAAGLQRNGFCDVPTWTYFGNSPVLAQLAQMLQTSVSNTIMEGAVHYKGFYTPPLNPVGGSTPGYVLSFSGVDYTTGWESLVIPIRSYSVTYEVRGGGLLYTTDMRVSTRQDPRTGENYYAHLSARGSGVFSPRFEGAFGATPLQVPDSGDPFGLGQGNGQLDTTGFAESVGLGTPRQRKSKTEQATDKLARRAIRERQRQDRETFKAKPAPTELPHEAVDISTPIPAPASATAFEKPTPSITGVVSLDIEPGSLAGPAAPPPEDRPELASRESE